jgi:oligoendopeptidase F
MLDGGKMPGQPVPPRSGIRLEDRWDASNVFVNDAAWEEEIAGVGASLASMAAYRGRLAESATTLCDALELWDDLSLRAERIRLYANMFYEVDKSDQAAVAKHGRALGVVAAVQAGLAFVEPELLEIGLDAVLSCIDQDPRLRTYVHYFDTLRLLQDHVCSPEIEEVLGLVADPFAVASATHGILADTNLPIVPARNGNGDDLEVSQGTIDALLADPDREVRRTAFEHYAGAHLAFRGTMANCIVAGVKQHVFQARVRKYGSSLEAALTPNYIPTDIFHGVIASFRNHLPVWHRYWAVRKKALGLDTLQPYDQKAPLRSRPLRVTFDQGMAWILEALQPLGDEYASVMKRGVLEQRWVDRYPNRGKRAGAFSSGVRGTHPFILMSYTDDIYSMSTLAHELGHSMHSYFTWQAQPSIYRWYGIFAAEVVSNFNQAMVRAHLLAKSTDRDFQIAVIEEAMNNFHRYFLIMPVLAQLELELHERAERGEPVTADFMTERTATLFAEAYGGEVAEDRERTGITWAEFPTHMYLNFYVFQYITGISGGNVLAQAVLDGKPGAVDRYLTFLKSGSSDYPLNLLKAAGVDLAGAEPIDRTFEVMAGLIDRLEQLVDPVS